MTPVFLPEESALFLLVAGLLGVVSVATFRFAAAMAETVVLGARETRRIRCCRRASTVVLAVSAVLAGVGILFLAAGW